LLQHFVNWLSGLSQGAGSFLGSFTGAAIGLIAILGGALFNARLNRRRDDRLRRDDARAVATALKAELTNISEALLRNADDVKKKPVVAPDDYFYVSDLFQSVRVMPEILQKIGLLPVETIQAALEAYGLLEQYCDYLIMKGGKRDDKMHRRVIVVPGKHADNFAKFNRQMNVTVQEAVEKLDAFLKKTG
jgi:hypothetical protein